MTFRTRRGVARGILSVAALLAAAGMAVAQSQSPIPIPIPQYEPPEFAPVTEAQIIENAPDDWPLVRGNYEHWGYSELDQITRDNVRELRLVWSRALEPGRQQEGSALAVNGVVYVSNPMNVIHAINAVTGELIWEYRRQLPDPSTFISGQGNKTRSVAIYDDKIYTVTWDNFVVALDARTGQVVWETDRGQGVEEGVTNSSGPIVVKGLVIAGSSCQNSGFGCDVTAHDAESGEEMWRMSFIPRPGEPGDETWGGSPFEARWMTGVWGQITYDPELDLVFFGTSGVGPASETQRGMEGATMYGTNTRFAVRPETGEVVWRHQTLPRDNWDTECTFEMIPVTTVVNPDADAEGMQAVGANVPTGETRRVLTGVPCKHGQMWQFDAATGEFFWVKDTVHQNIVESIDEAGLVTINEEMVLKVPGQTYPVCPGQNGGRDWPSASYYPPANTYIIPLNNVCEDQTPRDAAFTPANTYNWDVAYHLPPGKENIGRIDAIDIATGETKWSYEQFEALYAPVLTTAGGLVFVGGTDRYFKALDADTGELLWATRMPGGINGHVSTYEVDGTQYVAVVVGGVANSRHRARLELPDTTDTIVGGHGLFVFALDPVIE